MKNTQHIDPSRTRGRLYHFSYMREGILGEHVVPWFLEEGAGMLDYFRTQAAERLAAHEPGAVEPHQVVIIAWRAFDPEAHLPRKEG
jgi:hypothetical protein